MSDRSVINALHAAQSFGVVVPKKAFVFGHMVMLNTINKYSVKYKIKNFKNVSEMRPCLN